MPILVVCPSCHSSLKAADALLGATVKCPRCGQLLRLQERAVPPPAEPAPGLSGTFKIGRSLFPGKKRRR